MSRKHKPHASPPRPGAPAATAPDAEGLAQAALAAARYKDAIEQYKALLKAERRPQWIAALADAYAGRADQLAEKGMIKEAIALWRTRAEACATPLLSGRYVSWLLQGGQAEQAFALLGNAKSLTAEIHDWIQNELAAAALHAPDSWLAKLPPDMPLVRHRAAAQAAIAAASSGDDAALNEALQAIAFRSPYRDLRPLLRAMALLRTDPREATAMLDRIPPGGPFDRLAAALRVAAAPREQWLAGLRPLDDASRTLVLDLAGCPEAQRPLVSELARAADATALLECLVRQRQAMPDARSLCLRLLPHVPQRLDFCRSAFGPLAPDEVERMLALADELKQNHECALGHWLRLVDRWRNQPAQRMRAALVLRHLASNRRFSDSDEANDPQMLDWLAQSLDLDPTDRDGELRLLRGLRESGDLKQVRQRLDAARERFPGDSAVLIEAVHTALASGAFKKAIGLAKQVLQVDPINPQVRSVIGQAHLSHARKQIESRNAKGARRELEEARHWLRSTADLAILGALRGLAAEVPAEGDALLRQALADLGGTLAAAFQLGLEAARVRIEPPGVLRRAGADLNTLPGPAELVAFAQALNAQPAADRAARRALEPLTLLLQRAAAQSQGGENDLVLICDALHRHHLAGLTSRFAEQAAKRWPLRPEFVYFSISSSYAKDPWRIPPRDFDRLEDAFERAQERGDRRTASRLNDLLVRSAGMPRMHGGGWPGAARPMPDEDAPLGNGLQAIAAFAEVISQGGEKEVLAMIKGMLGGRDYEQLRREIGGDDKQFAARLVQLLASAQVQEEAQAAGRRPAPKRREQPFDDRQPGLFDD